MDFGQYNICNKYNDYYPTSTLVPNLKIILVGPYLNDNPSIDDHQPMLNSSTSKIQKDCKYILECLKVPAP